MAVEATDPIGFGQRLAELADRHPDRDAVVYLRVDGSETRLSWRELDRLVNKVARFLARRGLSRGKVAGLALPNHPLHVATALACWRLGATVLLLDSRSPLPELRRVVELASDVPVVLVGDGHRGSWPGTAVVSLQDMESELARTSGADVPDAVPSIGRMVPSGGSTGAPKIIVDLDPWVRVPGQVWGEVAPSVGFRPGQTQLVSGGMSHGAPFTWCQFGLFEGQTVVVLERADPAILRAALAAHRVQFMMVVPTLMKRLLDLGDLRSREFQSVEALYHTGAPCPQWLKRRWVELLGPERVFEMYGSTEGVGQAIVGGAEWLERPGTVGRPFQTDIRILDDRLDDVPAGEVGELYMRRRDGAGRLPFRYLGGAQAREVAGYVSVGDLARQDAAGYLFIAGRSADLIITGGCNVYPAEVEAALLAHPAVADVVVLGLPDETWGSRVHAVVVPADGATPTEEQLRGYLRTRLSPIKVPKTFELSADLGRSAFGKVRRDTLRASAGHSVDATLPAPPPGSPGL